MRNPIPLVVSPLLSVCNFCAGGLDSIGPEQGVAQPTNVQMRAGIAALMATQATFGTRRSELKGLYIDYTNADVALTTLLVKVNGTLATHFGTRWNANWAQAGYVNGSTAVPVSTDARIGLMAQVVDFFTTHPQYTSPNSGVTAQTCLDVHYAVSMAQLQLGVAKNNSTDALAARDMAMTKLQTLLRQLIKILGTVLAPLDGRWALFGLNRPGADGTPEQPQGLRATVDGDGNILAMCEATPLAQRYRFRGRLIGESRFRLLATSSEPMAMISGYEPGAVVELMVQAVAEGSQSVPSEAVVVEMPLPPMVHATALAEERSGAPAAKTAPRAGNDRNGGNGAASSSHRRPALAGAPG